jgi:hypothetical protein
MDTLGTGAEGLCAVVFGNDKVSLIAGLICMSTMTNEEWLRYSETVFPRMRIAVGLSQEYRGFGGRSNGTLLLGGFTIELIAWDV